MTGAPDTAAAQRPSVAIVGATGAVGREFLALLHERAFPMSELRALASERSAGSVVRCGDREVTVEALGDRSFDGVDIALFSAGGSISRRFAAAAREAGAVVIDNSSAFRMTDGVPLVIPEINGSLVDAVAGRGDSGAIIANPNCSTIIMLVPLEPLRARFGVEQIVVSTYQAVSGAGAAAMAELDAQTRAVLADEPARPDVFAHPCAFNVFSHDSAVDAATGRNVEEQKMIDETRKIWGDASVRVSATCVRVPVPRAHAESITVWLGTPATEPEVRSALADAGTAAGIEVVDDRAGSRFPMPIDASGRDAVLVGRIRPSAIDAADARGRHRVFDLFVCGDQIRKGAALNAVQIAERLVGR